MNSFFNNYYFFFKKKCIFFFSFYIILILIASLWLDILVDSHRWMDGAEYVERAKRIDLLNLNFQSLKDGLRPPLYPLVLHMLSMLFPFNLTIIAKIFNLLCLGVMPCILYLLSQKDSSNYIKKIYFIKINLLLIFLPNFYFADLVYAEVLTILIFNVFLYYLLSYYYNNSFNLKKIIIICILFALLFYLKSNLILLGFCLGLIVIKKLKKNIKSFIYIGLLSSILVFPWFFYMFNLTGQIKGSNSQHVNRLIGMGLDVVYGQNLDTFHGRFLSKAYKDNNEIIHWFKYYRTNMNEDALIKIHAISVEGNQSREALSKLSIEKIWEHSKQIQIIYSFLKIPHLFGMNLRDYQDYAIFAYFVFVFCFGILIRKIKNLKIFLYINLLVLVGLLIQTFLYFPTLRYSIYLLNSSLLIIAGFCFLLVKKKKA